MIRQAKFQVWRHCLRFALHGIVKLLSISKQWKTAKTVNRKVIFFAFFVCPTTYVGSDKLCFKFDDMAMGALLSRTWDIHCFQNDGKLPTWWMEKWFFAFFRASNYSCMLRHAMFQIWRHVVSRALLTVIKYSLFSKPLKIGESVY